MKHAASLLLSLTLLFAGGAACVPIAQPEGWAGPAYAGGGLYLAAKGGQLVAMNAADGSERWRFAPEGSSDRKLGVVYTAPQVAGGIVYVATYAGHLYALDAGTGAFRWQFPVGSAVIGGPVVSAGSLYVANSAGQLFALDAATGQPHWPQPFAARDGIWSQAAVDGERSLLYVTSLDHHLYAVDASTGRGRWEFRAEGALVGRPALDHGLVFSAGLDRVLYAVDAGTGQEKWRSAAGAGWIWASPLATGGRVYVADLEGEVRAFATANGEPRWHRRLDGPIVASPRLADSLLLVVTSPGRPPAVTSGGLHALDAATGQVRWAQPFPSGNGSQVRAEPAVGPDVAFLYGPRGVLSAIELATGRQRWQREVPAVQ